MMNDIFAETDGAVTKLRKTALEVVIVEDSVLLREMLIDVLSSLANITVVAEAEDEPTGLRLVEARQPDVVIVDLDLSAGSGIGILSAFHRDRERYGAPSVVVFTNHGSKVLRRRCEKLGIDEFFDKSYQLDDLIDYLQSERDARAR